MKKAKSFLAISIALAMVVGMTACNGNGSSSSESTASGDSSTTAAAAEAKDWSKADPITFDVFSQTANFNGEQGGWFGKILKDKFNVTLNIISGQGEGQNLFTTRSAAQDLGDIIIFGSNIQNFVDSATAGLLTDMVPLLEKEGQFVTETYPLAVNRMKKDYGEGTKVWGLPNQCTTEKATVSLDGNDLTYGNYMLLSAYKAAGSPKINTLEDILPALQKMQKAVPTASNGKSTYGFSLFKDWDGRIMCTAKQFCCVYGYDEWGFLLVNAMGDKYESVLADDGQYYRNLKLYHDANKLGLLDPDSATQDHATLGDKLKAGQILCDWWPWDCQGQYNTQERVTKSESNPNPDGYVLVPIADQKIFSNGFSPSGGNYQVAIGSKCDDPERAMALINWLYTPEANELIQNGPKGLTWELKDGKPVMTEEGLSIVKNPKSDMPAEYGGGTYEDGQCKLADFKFVAENGTDPNFGEPYLYSRWSSYSTDTDLMKEWSSTIGEGAATVHEYLDSKKQVAVAPGTAIQTPTLDTDTTTKQNSIQDVIRNYSWKMVMTKDDKEFDSYWASMKKEAKELGIDDVDKVYLAQYEKLKQARADAAAGK